MGKALRVELDRLKELHLYYIDKAIVWSYIDEDEYESYKNAANIVRKQMLDIQKQLMREVN